MIDVALIAAMLLLSAALITGIGWLTGDILANLDWPDGAPGIVGRVALILLWLSACLIVVVSVVGTVGAVVTA